MLTIGILVPFEFCLDPAKCIKQNNPPQVVNVEWNWFKKTDKRFFKGLYSNLAACKTCGVHAHSFVQRDSVRKVHQIPEFKGKSCFDILHTPLGNEIWQRTVSEANRYCFTINHKHPAVAQMRDDWGLPPVGKRKRSQEANNNRGLATGGNGNHGDKADGHINDVQGVDV